VVQINSALRYWEERAQGIVHNRFVVPHGRCGALGEHLGSGGKGTPVEFLIQPAEDPCFGGAECFEPAVDQEVATPARGRDFFGLFNDRTAATQVEFISLGSRFIGLRR